MMGSSERTPIRLFVMPTAILDDSLQYLAEQKLIYAIDHNYAQNLGQISMAWSLGLITMEQAEKYRENNRQLRNKLVDGLKEKL